jgi:hypothetical protein
MHVKRAWSITAHWRIILVRGFPVMSGKLPTIPAKVAAGVAALCCGSTRGLIVLIAEDLRDLALQLLLLPLDLLQLLLKGLDAVKFSLCCRT